MYYFQQLSNLWVRALYCDIMSEDRESRSHKGSAGWIIVGVVVGLAVIFIVVIAFSSTLFPSGPRAGAPSETADQSATSGPGHNTTASGGAPLGSQDNAVANTGPSTGQIPDSEVTYGRETSTLQTTTGQEQGLNNTGNGTNGGLENPLSENLTSLTGTSGTS
jgi:cytoskeletal protein RodZ